jgi:hypothetical protein
MLKTENGSDERILSQFRTGLNRALPKALRPATLADRFLSRSLADQSVLGGPFRGMRYIPESVGSMLLPKLLGSYEIELNPILEGYLSHKPCVFVDVGAAEGYFAGGLAWRCPGARVIAFEAENAGQVMLARLARLNGLSDRIEIRGFCNQQALIGLLRNCRPTLLIVDIEGGEAELLSAEIVKMLKDSDLIVELHPWIIPGIEALLTQRFASTHRINVIHTRKRRAGDLPFGIVINHLLSRWLVPKLNELRPEPMKWLHLIAKKQLRRPLGNGYIEPILSKVPLMGL